MDIITDAKRLQPQNHEIWIEEAEFGFRHVEAFVQHLEDQSDILEVGCGSGILLAMLSSQFKAQSFNGLEPFGEGFSCFSEMNNLSKQYGAQIENISYEHYNPGKKFDLIYCVNVFEHLQDWRNFLLKASSWLKDDGKILILCPNYDVPYESHFRIPVIGNKTFSYKIFKNHIQNAEQKLDQAGLWESLNFVKKSDVVKFLRAKPDLVFYDHISVIDDMIERVLHDEHYRRRQRVVGFIALFLRKTGLLNLMKRFPNLLPYMKFEIRKTSGDILNP